jgi:hypothetical protein
MLDEKNIHEIFDSQFIKEFKEFYENKEQYINNREHPYYMNNVFFDNIMNINIFNKDQNFDVPQTKNFINDLFFNLNEFTKKYYTNTKHPIKNTLYDNINIINDFGFLRTDLIRENKIKDFALNLVNLYKQRIDCEYSINQLLSYSKFDSLTYNQLYLFKKNNDLKFYRYDKNKEMFFYPFHEIYINNDLWNVDKNKILLYSELNTSSIPINYGIIYRMINESNIYLYYLKDILDNQFNNIGKNNNDLKYNDLNSSFIGFYLLSIYIDDYIGKYMYYDRNDLRKNNSYLNITRDINLDIFNNNYLNGINIKQYQYLYNKIFNKPYCKNNNYKNIFDMYEINFDKFTSDISYKSDGKYIKKSNKYNLNEFVNNNIRLDRFYNIYDYEMIKINNNDPDNILPYNDDKLIALYYNIEINEDNNNAFKYYINQSTYEDNKYVYISGGIDELFLVSTNNDNEFDKYLIDLIDIPYIPIEGNIKFNSYVKYDKDIVFKYRNNISIEHPYLYQYFEEYDTLLLDDNISDKIKENQKEKQKDKYHDLNDFKENELLNKLYEYRMDEEYENNNGVVRYYLQLKKNNISIKESISNSIIKLYDKNNNENFYNIKIDKDRKFIGHNIVKVRDYLYVFNGLYTDKENNIYNNDLLYRYDMNNKNYIMNPIDQLDLQLINAKVFNYSDNVVIIMGGYKYNLEKQTKIDNKDIYLIFFDENGNIYHKEILSTNVSIKNVVFNKKHNVFYLITKNEKQNKVLLMSISNITDNPTNLILIMDEQAIMPKEIDNLDDYILHYFNNCLYIFGGLDKSDNDNTLNYNKYMYVMDLTSFVNKSRHWYKIKGFKNEIIFLNNVNYNNEKDIYLLHPIYRKDNLYHVKNDLVKIIFDITVREDYNITSMSGQKIIPYNNYCQVEIKNKNISNINYNNNLKKFDTYRDELLNKKYIINQYVVNEDINEIDTSLYLRKYFPDLKIYMDEIIDYSNDIENIIKEKNKIIEIIQQKLNILFNDKKHFNSYIEFDKNEIYDYINTIKPINNTILKIEDNFQTNDIPFNLISISDNTDIRLDIFLNDNYRINDYSLIVEVNEEE